MIKQFYVQAMVAGILTIWSICNCVVKDDISWEAFYPLTVAAIIQVFMTILLAPFGGW